MKVKAAVELLKCCSILSRCALLIDHFQNLINSSPVHGLLIPQIHENPPKNFLSYSTDRQTDRQTDSEEKVTHSTSCQHSLNEPHTRNTQMAGFHVLIYSLLPGREQCLQIRNAPQLWMGEGNNCDKLYQNHTNS